MWAIIKIRVGGSSLGRQLLSNSLLLPLEPQSPTAVNLILSRVSREFIPLYLH